MRSTYIRAFGGRSVDGGKRGPSAYYTRITTKGLKKVAKIWIIIFCVVVVVLFEGIKRITTCLNWREGKNRDP